MATKFSQFGSVSPSATTEIVGLDGGLNSKFQVGNIDVSNLTGFPLTIQLGGTGATTPKAALNNITDATTQTIGDVLTIVDDNGVNVAEFQAPTSPTSPFVTKAGGNTITWDLKTDGPNLIVNLTLSENKLVVANATDFDDGSTGYVIFNPVTSSNYKLPDVDHGSGAGITSKLTNGNTNL